MLRITKYCNHCGMCKKQCPAGAICSNELAYWIDQTRCVKCGRCLEQCRAHAIEQVKEGVE